MIDPSGDRVETRGAKPRKAAVASKPRTPGGGRLGKREIEFPPPTLATGDSGGLTCINAANEGAQDRAKSGAETDPAKKRRKERYANRRLLWRLSGDKAVQTCGRGVVDQGAGVTVNLLGDRAYTSGVVRCGKIWLDPVCSAKIRAERADEIGPAVAEFIRSGGTAYMVTLTARHYRRHKLADLLDALTEAWKKLMSGAQWAGDPARGREGERARMGVVGFIRSTEVTVGIRRNGWHPHLHVILLMGGVQQPRPKIPRKQDRPDGWVKPEWDPRPVDYFRVPDPSEDPAGLSDEERQVQANFVRMRERWERTWTSWLEKHGFRPSRHGIQWDRIESVEDARNLGEYIAKTQEGRAVGHEVARGDMKDARREGNLTPFQLLTRYRQIRDMTAQQMEGLEAIGRPVDKELALIEKYWREYEEATKGRRAIEWSRDLRRALALGEERTDEEIVGEEEHGEPVAHLTAPTWGTLCRLGLDYEALAAAEAGGFVALVAFLAKINLTADHPDERQAMVRAQYGRVVLPPGTWPVRRTGRGSPGIA